MPPLLALLLFLVPVACSGEGQAAVTVGAHGGTVTSDDGTLTLEIPAAALETETAIAVRRLDPDEWPEALAPLRIVGDVYEFEPGGLTFSAPITIVRRIDAALLDIEEGPVVHLGIRDADGTFTILEDTSLTIDDEELVVTGRMDHFSTQFVFDSGVAVSFEPLPGAAYAVGDTFPVTATIRAGERAHFELVGAGARATSSVIERVRPPHVRPLSRSEVESVRLALLPFPPGEDVEFELKDVRHRARLPEGSRWQVEAQFTCRTRGRGTYMIWVTFQDPATPAPVDYLRSQRAWMFPDTVRRYAIEIARHESFVWCLDAELDEGVRDPFAPPTRVRLAEEPEDVVAGEESPRFTVEVTPDEAEEAEQLLDAAGYDWELIIVDPVTAEVIETRTAGTARETDRVASGRTFGLEVQPIRAVFDPPSQSTTYRAAFTHEPGGRIHFQWAEPDCGSWEIAAEFDGEPVTDLGQGERDRGGFPPLAVSEGELIFVWAHPHPPCDPTTDHAHVTIQLRVEDDELPVASAEWSPVVCTYQGAATGTGPPCERRE